MAVPIGEITLVVSNPLGLHARPSVQLIECIQKFEATVWINYQEQELVIDSLLDLLSLCIPHGASVTFKAEGKDADAVLKAIRHLCTLQVI
ncbi:MAG: HPr family phosphocarrier protein [Alphaproteobacteria bacterium]|nr:HPr family phosphocarrier protein [Alphaproteobacteria bacterium]